MNESDLVSQVLSTYSQSVSITCNTLPDVKAVDDDFVLFANLYYVGSWPMLYKSTIHLNSHLHRLKYTPSIWCITVKPRLIAFTHELLCTIADTK